MLFTHINPFPEGMIGADNLVYNGSIIFEIIDSFRAGTSYISTPTSGDFAQSVSIYFSLQGLGTVIAYNKI